MKFIATPLAGVFVVEAEPKTDERGFFARTFCPQEFAAQGLAGDFAQSSISWNSRQGTLRGMHYQRPPHAETKLVRCTRGEIFDVALDLRQDSPSYGLWFGTRLNQENRRQLY
ncbi:MAG: dTDP-4-dehydrorhamnose 3,5-epimerase family protein, partial [Nevskiales bacterium]